MNKGMICLYKIPLAYETLPRCFRELSTPNVKVAEARRILLSKLKFFGVTLLRIFLRVSS